MLLILLCFLLFLMFFLFLLLCMAAGKDPYEQQRSDEEQLQYLKEWRKKHSHTS